MKTVKNQLLLFTTVSFVILFYGQGMGLNLSIFAMIVWGSLLLLRKKIYKDKKFIFLSVCVITSAGAFAWYGDFISFAALYLSLIIAGFYTLFLNKLNMLNLAVLLPANYASFPVRIFMLNKWLYSKNKITHISARLIAYYIIPGFFAVIFVIVYSNSSSLLSGFFSKFLTDFKMTEIVGLTALGFFLMFNFYHFMIPRIVIYNNKNLEDNFSADKRAQKASLYNFDVNLERKSGEITLILLNILLLLFLVVYNTEQFQFSSKDTLSSNVHERIYTIIFSIVLAVSIILLYFKNTFNFDESAARLKLLAYVWIGLNLLLMLSALVANSIYVQAYALTFKRIGVYIFLLLSMIGLYFTYNKIREKKTNIYLVKNMFWAFFITLVISSAINWSWIVTKYAINYSEKPDLYYLFYNTEFNREIFYRHYKNEFTKGWQGKTGDERYKDLLEAGVDYEKHKKLLSRKLYYHFLELK